MKKLIFIDNDIKECAEKDFSTAKRSLKYNFDLSPEIVSSMELVHSLNWMDDKEKAKLILNPQHIIVTWSMYTWNHYGSLYTLMDFLENAGKLGFKDLIYIDTSGNVEKAIKDELHSSAVDRTKEEIEIQKNIFKAINSNYIISLTDNDDLYHPYRLRILGNQKEFYDKFFHEDIDLNKLIKNG